MVKRLKIRKIRKDKKIFSKTARKTRKENVVTPMRGGKRI